MIPLTPESTYQHTDPSSAAQLAEVPGAIGADSLADAQRFLRHVYSPLSRSDWRKCPLEFLLVVTVDAPYLVFGWSADFWDAVAGQRIVVELEREELRADARRIKEAKAAGDTKTIKFLTARVRRRWSRLVDHAEGYTYPGAGIGAALGVFEFAPDKPDAV